MKASEAQKRASKKWEDNNMESIRFRVPKGKKELINECAVANGESVNSMLNRLTDKEIERIKNKHKWIMLFYYSSYSLW